MSQMFCIKGREDKIKSGMKEVNYWRWKCELRVFRKIVFVPLV
jgi:hypothetical protein